MKKRLQSILSTCVNVWKEAAQRTEPGSLQGSPVTGPEAVGTNWNVGLNIRKQFFTVRVTKHWNRCPGVLWASISVGVQKLSGHGLGSWVSVSVTEQGAWTRGAPHPLPFCDSVITILICFMGTYYKRYQIWSLPGYDRTFIAICISFYWTVLTNT